MLLSGRPGTSPRHASLTPSLVSLCGSPVSPPTESAVLITLLRKQRADEIQRAVEVQGVPQRKNKVTAVDIQFDGGDCRVRMLPTQRPIWGYLQPP